MKRVFQQNINQPTEELSEQVLRDLTTRPVTVALIDNYRLAKRQMVEAEARQAIEAFVRDTMATQDYQAWLSYELKKDERRKKKRMPSKDLEAFFTSCSCILISITPYSIYK